LEKSTGNCGVKLPAARNHGGLERRPQPLEEGGLRKESLAAETIGAGRKLLNRRRKFAILRCK